ncbi:MAG: phage portal protein [Eubacterium sp.]|nr:phage portal protein [Eubacterium sp.]
MGFFKNFFSSTIKTKYLKGDTVVIDIPSSLYYKELAIYTAVSMLSNAISRSEIKCFINGKEQKNEDYYKLNIAPNINETSSIFWHKVVNKMVWDGETVVVDIGGNLYVADSFMVEEKRPVKGDIISNVQVGVINFRKKFQPKDIYRFRLDDKNVKVLIDGVWNEYDKVLSAAKTAFVDSNCRKYKLKVNAMKAGDEDFEEEFKNHIANKLKDYLKEGNAVYPEFDGYELKADESKKSTSTKDLIEEKQDFFKTVAAAFHIPDSMMSGNITNMKDIIDIFLTFGVDPYADCIEEALNKRAGVNNFINKNFYKVDTGRIHHRDIFEIATGIINLVSSAGFSIDEVRAKLGEEPLNEWWSQKHFITKNFEEVEKYLKSEEGGTNEKAKILPNNTDR